MAERATREQFVAFTPITSRWHDNDLYGHVNNVVYYSYFDSAINEYLIREGGLDIHGGDVVGYVVNSSCDYFEGVAFPQKLEAGIRVNKLGNSSVQYGIGIFREGDDACAASGSFTHVFVNRETERPAVMPEQLRAALEQLVLATGTHT